MVVDPEIPTFPEPDELPKIFVAVVVVACKKQTAFSKTNPFPHLTHLKSGVKVMQFAGIFPANPNIFNKYITPVFPISKVTILELKEAPDEPTLFEL